MISSGSYGDVYSASSIKDNIEICLKEINLEKMKLNYKENELTNYLKDLNNEIKILKLLSYNKNSVKFYGSYDENNQKVIVMEKCDKNLRQFIKERGSGMEIEEIKVKFIELNKLFKLIQKENIIHRDLKLENFLIKYTDIKKNEYIIKLCDYGIGKFKNESNGLFSGIKGTPETISPEILLQKIEIYENIVDIFSLGIILYQLSHNLKHPFDNNNNQLYGIYSANYDKDNITINFDESIKNKEFKDLIVKMTKLNPKNRLKWDKYFEHPFFK
jgi:serine/threonine protein kinase